MNYGCYSGATGEMVDSEHLSSWRYMEPFFDQKGTICLDKGVKWVFLSMLLMLQVLSIVWFGMILKVAYGVLKGAPAEDSRSGDEDELDDEAKCEKDPIIEEVKHTASAKIRPSTSDGVPIQPAYFRDGGGGRLRIPRSRDRKEMIGRVGCNGSLD
jgi:acyl-CoA-dependent ceramide synthase